MSGKWRIVEGSGGVTPTQGGNITPNMHHLRRTLKVTSVWSRSGGRQGGGEADVMSGGAVAERYGLVVQVEERWKRVEGEARGLGEGDMDGGRR